MKKGFTLAEVLITLGIIGIVAALTLPSLNAYYQKHVTVTRLQKAYNSMSNTINIAISEEGPIETWNMPNTNTAEDSLNFVNTYIVPFLKIAQNCETKTTGICEFKYQDLNSSTQTSLGDRYARFYLADGTLVALASVYESGGRRYGDTLIDINGQAKPNIVGKDIFCFRYELNNGKFFPTDYGWSRNDALNHQIWGCNRNASGTYCSNVIMKDGWKISDDYPW